MGREFTVSILGDKTLPIVEILPSAFFYDFTSKYTKGGCDYIVPAKVEKLAEEKIILCIGSFCKRKNQLVLIKGKWALSDISK